MNNIHGLGPGRSNPLLTFTITLRFLSLRVVYKVIAETVAPKIPIATEETLTQLISGISSSLSYEPPRPLVVHIQQRLALAPTLVRVGEDERERAQDVIKVGAAQAVEVRHKRVNLVAQTLALGGIGRAARLVPIPATSPAFEIRHWRPRGRFARFLARAPVTEARSAHTARFIVN